ncbi:MAG TPA: extracellular solute-binding protein [Beijerinckiaceae bacterium]|nr:extracellular solute-binding protein [Beijerinckiaceae bacterium]
MTVTDKVHRPDRRSLLAGAGAFVGVSTLLPSGTWAQQAASFGPERHGLSIFGDLKYPPGFAHFDYVNPSAPKGGEMALQVSSVGGNQNFLTFDTLNMFSSKGSGAAGLGLIFDSLMSSAADEPDSMYGLVARSVQASADGLTYRFHLRPEARFQDGTPLTAEDVAFSLTLLKSKGYPTYRLILKDLVSAEARAADIVDIRFAPGRSREMPLIVAGMPILSKTYYETKDFEAATLEQPLASGPYKVLKADAGRSVTYQRDPNYWGAKLAVHVGTSNFERVRYEYFRDREAAFQGFTSGTFTYREEFTSLIWATRYTFPAFRDGRVKREVIEDHTPSGTQGWFLNTRRPQFKDRRIREAVGLAFDFEWSNKNLMYDSYRRTVSYFENSTLKATGRPSPEELALLEPFRGKVPDEVFGEPFVPPVSDGSGQDRTILRRAQQLLQEAGCKRDGGGRLSLPDGKPFTIEFMEDEPSLNRHMEGFVKNLKLLGIEASIRVVDATQFQRRVEDFDFDLISRRWNMGETPGENLKVLFHSDNANARASRNLSGVADPVVDALVQKAIDAKSRAELVVACQALDRVLRAGRYWVSAWFKGSHWVAYWDMFDRPKEQPRYGFNPVGTWWHDAEKAKRIGL